MLPTLGNNYNQMQLTNIENIIAEPLWRFRLSYKQAMASDVEVLHNIGTQLSSNQGKQLRPIFMLLCFGASQACYNGVEHLAVALEMLHNSSLLHDDVVDESAMRRGKPTANSLYGNKIAVLCGDYFLAKVMLMLDEFNDREVNRIVEHVVMEMSIGELLQQSSSGIPDTTIEQYLDVIGRKTASLLAASCELGALGTPYRAALREYGRHFGLAFQMRDDLLDYLPVGLTGKPTGNDLMEHKMTLPLIYFLKEAKDDEAAFLQRILKKGNNSKQDIARAVDIIYHSNAVALTQQAIGKEAKQALLCLDTIPESDYKEGLKVLTQFLNENLY
ncbi:MAG: polyprenyl synthetase family protein [Bacteroidales bacterium]|nr:polyprenyl synthetase family protein [Bacteroidales bacterium]